MTPAERRRRFPDGLPSDPMDLLTPEERAQLDADLLRMARLRRSAEIESANIEMH